MEFLKKVGWLPAVLTGTCIYHFTLSQILSQLKVPVRTAGRKMQFFRNSNRRVLITWKSWYEPTYKPSFILDCICIWKINKECEIQKYFSHTLPYFFIFPLCVLLISGKDQRSQDMNHLLCWRSLSKWNRRRRNAPFLRKRKTETQSSSSR